MERPEDRLALIECFERDGRPARVLDVAAWPLTLGRAMDNHVVLDDAHVAAHHARIEPAPGGGVQLVVLDTRNGVTVDGRHFARDAQVPLPAGGAGLQLGASRLRLRLPGETLAAERPLPTLNSAQALRPLLAGAALWVLALAEHALVLDPGVDATAWLPVLLGLPALVGGWCGVWALMSKLFQHRFDFNGHLRIALPWLLGIQLAASALPQLAALFGWPWLWHAAPPLQVLLGALMVRQHLAHVLPMHGRAVNAVVAAAVLVGGGISLQLIHRSTDRLTRAPYMSTLPLPALHWAPRVTPEQLMQDMAPLAERLAERVKRARREEVESGGEEPTPAD